MMFLIPKPYEYLGAALIVSLFGGLMYFKGWSGEHDKLVAYSAQVALVGQQQAAKAKQEDAFHEEQNKELVASWLADRRHLLANIDRMRNNYSGGGSLPQDAGSPESADAQGGEPSRACKGTEFYYKALTDAQTVDMWNEWAIAHHLPVE